jgi:hypothetical protein
MAAALLAGGWVAGCRLAAAGCVAASTKEVARMHRKRILKELADLRNKSYTFYQLINQYS